MVSLTYIMDSVSVVFELAGVAVIVLGFLWALWRALECRTAANAGRRAYHRVRRIFGKSILLGLEILVAADLIRTIAIEPTIANLQVLGLLILIRTALSWSLDVELEGMWPWEKRRLLDDEQLSGIRFAEEEE